MTTTAAFGITMMDEIVGDGETVTGDWLLPTVLIVAAVVILSAVAAVLRERHHRRRQEELHTRLTDLEGILIGLSNKAKGDGGPAASPPVGDTTATADQLVPRGPLSTAISVLYHDLGPGLPGPDRVDLRATIFVYEHLGDPLTPADLAGDLNLSLRSLQRGLSTSLGCTPRELILAVKMREAKRFLLDEECRVQEAARAVGFDDPFHFSRRFKAYYRMSPTEMQLRRGRSVA